MKLDPRNLRYLLAIAQHRTYRDAAIAEGISQPAMSNRIATLERQLGVRVFERGRHGAELTDYGKLLVRHARALDSVLERIVQEIDLEKRGLKGPLSIGGTPVALLRLVPEAISLLARNSPRISISILKADDQQLLEKLHSGEIQLMLGSVGIGSQSPELVEDKLADFPVRVIASAASPFWSRRSVTLQELADVQWVMPAVGNAFRQSVEAVFLHAGVPFPKSYWSCSSMMSLKAMVQYNDCISMLPTDLFALEARAGLLRGIKLRDVSFSRAVAVVKLRNWPLSPIAERFVAMLHEGAKRLR
jgi:DNA-binding transcriptional LysR family regulator